MATTLRPNQRCGLALFAKTSRCRASQGWRSVSLLINIFTSNRITELGYTTEVSPLTEWKNHDTSRPQLGVNNKFLEAKTVFFGSFDRFNDGKNRWSSSSRYYLLTEVAVKVGQGWDCVLTRLHSLCSEEIIQVSWPWLILLQQDIKRQYRFSRAEFNALLYSARYYRPELRNFLDML
jgi:hypothetical protein